MPKFKSKKQAGFFGAMAAGKGKSDNDADDKPSQAQAKEAMKENKGKMKNLPLRAPKSK